MNGLGESENWSERLWQSKQGGELVEVADADATELEEVEKETEVVVLVESEVVEWKLWTAVDEREDWLVVWYHHQLPIASVFVGSGALEDGKTNGRSEWGDAESEVEGREALGQERTILVLEIAKVPEGLVAGNLKDFESIVFVVADFQVIGVERNLPLLFNPLHNTRKHTVKRVGLGPDGGAAAEPGPGAGDGALVERLLSSESEVTVGSTGGWDGGDSGTGRIGVGVGPASDVGGADGVDSTGSETEAVGLGGGGISVDGRADTGVDAIRRRLTRRSGAGGGE
eukprot:s61_g20.t1